MNFQGELSFVGLQNRVSRPGSRVWPKKWLRKIVLGQDVGLPVHAVTVCRNKNWTNLGTCEKQDVIQSLDSDQWTPILSCSEGAHHDIWTKASQSISKFYLIASKNPPEQSLDPFQMLSHQNADRSYHLLAYFNHSFKRTLLFPSLNHSGASSASCALLCIALGICSSSPTWLQHLAHGYHHQWWGWLRHGLSVKFLGYSNCHFFWQFLNITLW